MYNISAPNNQASQVQVGHGAYQVFDTSQQTAAANHQAAAAGQADQAIRAKKLDDSKRKTTDLLNNQVGAVHPSDLPAFQQKTADYRKNVLDSIKKGGGELSIEDEAALNQQWNNITQQSLSSAKRAEAERAGLAKLNNPNEFYRTGEHKTAHEGFQTSSFNDKGEADFESKVNPVAMYNIEKEVVDPLASHIISQVNANEVDRVKGIPPAQSAEYARSIGDNPAVAKELHGQLAEMADEGTYANFISKVYGDPKTAKGVDNPSYIADPKLREAKITEVSAGPDKLKKDNNKDITAYEFVDRFLLHGVDPAPEHRQSKWEYERDHGVIKPAKQTVAGVLKEGEGGKKTFQFEYTNTQDNPYITIPDPENRGESIEVKPYQVEYDGSKTQLKVLSKPHTDEEGVRQPGKELNLNYGDVKDIMNNKFGIDNVFKLLDPNTTPEHVKVTRSDTKVGGKKDQAKVDNKAKGEVYEYNGHSGTKEEWIKNGWTEDQLNKHAKKK